MLPSYGALSNRPLIPVFAVFSAWLAAVSIVMQQSAFAEEKTFRAMLRQYEAVRQEGKYLESAELIAKIRTRNPQVFDEEFPSGAQILEEAAVELYRAGQYDRAEQVVGLGLNIRKKRQGENHPDNVGLLVVMGGVRLEQRRNSEAEEIFKRALSIRGERRTAAAKQEQVEILNGLGLVYQNQGRDREAAEVYDSALAILEWEDPKNWQLLAYTVRRLAYSCLRLRWYEIAKRLFDHAMWMDEAMYGRRSRMYVASLRGTAWATMYLKKFVEAEKHFQTLERITRSVYGVHSSELAHTYVGMLLLYHGLKDEEKARRYLKLCVAIHEACPAGQDIELPIAMRRLSEIALEMGQIQEAKRSCERSLEILQGSPEGKHREIFSSMLTLAKVYERDRRYLDAQHVILKILQTETGGPKEREERFDACLPLLKRIYAKTGNREGVEMIDRIMQQSVEEGAD